MTIFFSKSVGNFVDDTIWAKLPDDAVEVSQEDYRAFVEARNDGTKVVLGDESGKPYLADAPPPSPEQIKTMIVDAVQRRLDDFAKTRAYDGILSAATYATSTVPNFATEGQYAVEVRDATWSKLYQILAEVEAGTRPIPAGYADIEPELPVLAWPN
jgi:hypothetical protein